ncbi:MAG: CGNR zinc finger domain-containing protein [Nocardioides sp.]|uniref:CGNR zinc finger domain-containing protein n=1 Tax=Nocardioides sp. TaxID=35761 RepID=UPI0039E546E4
MVFAHDTEMTLQAVVELVNTAGEPDLLTRVEELDEFYDRWGYTGRHERTRAELDDVRASREGLRTLLLADRDDAAAMVNDILREAHAVPRLVRHDPLDWHIHAEPLDAPLATQIAVEAAVAMIDVIRDNESSRISVCAIEDCASIALDLSRNRSKRFCSVTCGNRAAQQAYRARRG